MVHTLYYKETKMPHYMNGREAKLGDKCVTMAWDGSFHTVVLSAIQTNEEACNATGEPLLHGSTTVVLSKAMHIDDVAFIAKVDIPTPVKE